MTLAQFIGPGEFRRANAMNHLQWHGIVSDNALWPEDVHAADHKTAIDWLVGNTDWAKEHEFSVKSDTGIAAPAMLQPAGNEQGPRVKGKFYPPESNQHTASVSSRLRDNQSEGSNCSGGLPLNTPNVSGRSRKNVRVSG